MKVLKFILALLLLLMVFDILVSSVLSYAYEHTYQGDTGIVNYYLKKAKNKEVIVLGNSRAQSHIDPKEFPIPISNLARSGREITYHLGILHLILERKIPCKKIILHVDPNELICRKKEDKEFSYRNIQHLKYYYGENEFITKHINGLSTFERLKYIFQSYRFNGEVLKISKHYILTDDSKMKDGFEPRWSSVKDSSNTLLRLPKYTTCAMEFVNDSVVKLIVEFSKLCKVNKIELLCFTSPVFFDARHLNSEISPLQKELEKLEIPYINYRDSLNTYFSSPSLWADAAHLNNKGATLFSKKFCKDVQHFLTN